MLSLFQHYSVGSNNHRTNIFDKKQQKEEEAHNKRNLEILDSILDDDEEKFMNLLEGHYNSTLNQPFHITNYKVPEYLDDNLTYSSLCACFGAEKCFKSLSILHPGGSEEMLKLDNSKRSPIHFACIGGNMTIIRELEQVGVDVNSVDKFGFYPCHYAAMFDRIDVMKHLWMKGSDIITSKTTYKPNIMPIHIACLFGSMNVTKLILEIASSKNQLNDILITKTTPLHCACFGGQKKIIEYIQQFPEFYQKQVKVIDEDSMTPIVCACRSGSLDCVKQILKKSKINLSMKGRKKNPLIEAAEYGHYEIVKFLIMQGADIQQLNSGNCSALKKAVLNDHFDIVKYLIENGAAKYLDKISITFMMDAVLQSADYDMIIYFDNHFNIPYDLITGFGRTNGERYMDIACSNQDEKTIDFLLNKNVGLSKIDIPKLINSKKISILNFLITKGLNISDYKSENDCPLIVLIIQNGSYDDVINFISYGATLNKEIIEKYHCLQIACGNHDIKLFDYLLSYKPEVSPEEPYNFIKEVLKKNLTEKSYEMIDKILSLYQIDFNRNVLPYDTLITIAINRKNIELLDMYYKHGADYTNCIIHFPVASSDSYLSCYEYLKNRGCNFKNIKSGGILKSNPLNCMLESALYLNGQNYLKMTLFLLDFSTPVNIMNAKFYDYNLIDYFMNYDFYKGVSKAFDLTKKVFYPIRTNVEEFKKWIKKSNDQNLINLVLKQ